MAENILEEQMIEVVDASNTFVGYVSGTLPQKEDDTSIVMIDNDLNDHDNDVHDNDHDTDSTISVGPEAPPEILSNINMDIDNQNTLSPIENSDNESDSYEIITECQNQPNQPSINILNYPADIENADDYAVGWEWQ